MSALAQETSSHAPDEQDRRELRDTVRRALLAVAPVETTLKLMEADRPWDEAGWRRLADEVGLPALTVPQEYDGQGFGRVEEGIVLEELGRVLYPGPLVPGAVLAGGALRLAAAAGSTTAARWLPAIAEGTLSAALVLPGSAEDVRLTGTGAGATVDGRAAYVIGGIDADLFVLVGHGPEGPVLTAVERGPAVSVEPVSVLDLTRPLAHVRFAAAPAVPLVEGPDTDLVHAVRNLARSALTSESAGAARAALEITVAYAQTRVQFGRLIGSFQAVRHRLADLLAEVEIASEAAEAAAAIPDSELATTDADITVATAVGMVIDTFTTVAEQTVQLHGGIGFTWEHPAHMYLKRAKATELLLGGAERSRAELFDALQEASA
ncbi:acyl-CoA dehydrogenase family protein [Pseudonocardia ailaonensis]|uniref:Acyl-CoA dehydrogenase family protein n=1 Tax=Pseudonocardia ailaonensis TaxID=367279 RepID=A0ABN2MKQ1_9PSEU